MLIEVILAAVLGLPLIIGLAMRVSTSHLFFSLMAGELLGSYFGEDVDMLMASVLGDDRAYYGEIILLTLPMLVTGFLLKGTLARHKTMLHVVPLAFTGVVFAAFLLPHLPAELLAQIDTTQIGGRLLNLHKTIVGIVVLMQLVSLWILNRKEPGDKKFGKKK